MGEVDHPLDTTGIEQVRALEERIQKLLSGDVTGYPEDEREYLEQLKGAGCVFVSPLTRAFQTCVIGVHPILKKVKDLYVIRAAKEKQNLGGRDTKVGIEIGHRDVIIHSCIKGLLIVRYTHCEVYSLWGILIVGYTHCGVYRYLSDQISIKLFSSENHFQLLELSFIDCFGNLFIYLFISLFIYVTAKQGEEVGKDIVKKVRKCTAESLGEEAAARYVDVCVPFQSPSCLRYTLYVCMFVYSFV